MLTWLGENPCITVTDEGATCVKHVNCPFNPGGKAYYMCQHIKGNLNLITCCHLKTSANIMLTRHVSNVSSIIVSQCQHISPSLFNKLKLFVRSVCRTNIKKKRQKQHNILQRRTEPSSMLFVKPGLFLKRTSGDLFP